MIRSLVALLVNTPFNNLGVLVTLFLPILLNLSDEINDLMSFIPIVRNKQFTSSRSSVQTFPPTSNSSSGKPDIITLHDLSSASILFYHHIKISFPHN